MRWKLTLQFQPISTLFQCFDTTSRQVAILSNWSIFILISQAYWDKTASRLSPTPKPMLFPTPTPLFKVWPYQHNIIPGFQPLPHRHIAILQGKLVCKKSGFSQPFTTQIYKKIFTNYKALWWNVIPYGCDEIKGFWDKYTVNKQHVRRGHEINRLI